MSINHIPPNIVKGFYYSPKLERVVMVMGDNTNTLDIALPKGAEKEIKKLQKVIGKKRTGFNKHPVIIDKGDKS